MKNLSVTGMQSFSLEGEYDHILISGMGQCAECKGGTVQVNELKVPGMLTFYGISSVAVKKFSCTGMCKNIAHLQTQDFSLHGMLNAGEIVAEDMTVNGKVTADSICAKKMEVTGDVTTQRLQGSSLDIHGLLRVNGKAETVQIQVNGCMNAENLEAESLQCPGVITVQQQVCVDKVHVDGVIKAGEIVGDKIFIDSRPYKNRVGLFNKRVVKSREQNASHANLIEATTVELYNVKADQVNGQEVMIGADCVIKQVDCNGTLKISRSAKVGNITGSYTLHEVIE